MDRVDIREMPGFYQKLAECINAALSNSEMQAKLMRAFPLAKCPSKEGVNSWLGTKKTWQELAKHFERPELERLFNLYLARCRSNPTSAERKRFLTLDEMLADRPPAAKQPPTFPARRYA